MITLVETDDGIVAEAPLQITPPGGTTAAYDLTGLVVVARCRHKMSGAVSGINCTVYAPETDGIVWFYTSSLPHGDYEVQFRVTDPLQPTKTGLSFPSDGFELLRLGPRI